MKSKMISISVESVESCKKLYISYIILRFYSRLLLIVLQLCTTMYYLIGQFVTNKVDNLVDLF